VTLLLLEILRRRELLQVVLLFWGILLQEILQVVLLLGVLPIRTGF
jgi:hypothetical protein